MSSIPVEGPYHVFLHPTETWSDSENSATRWHTKKVSHETEAIAETEKMEDELGSVVVVVCILCLLLMVPFVYVTFRYTIHEIEVEGTESTTQVPYVMGDRPPSVTMSDITQSSSTMETPTVETSTESEAPVTTPATPTASTTSPTRTTPTTPTMPTTPTATTMSTTPTATTMSTTPTTPTTSSTTTTTYRPFDPSYQRKNLSGLLCQTGAAEFLSVETPDACDFFIVEFATNPAQPHPIYSYMATVEVTSKAQRMDVVDKVRASSSGSLLLLVQRSVLHSFSPDSGLDTHAVVRGLVQLVVDTHAHGVVLGDRELREHDLPQVYMDAKDLSADIHPYHGLVRYDEYTGKRAALRILLADVSNMPHITFVFRASGISRTFTHPYYDNFYLKKLNQQNLSWIIDEDVTRPLKNFAGRKSVALSMSLMARSCPPNTIFNANSTSKCIEVPLNMTRLCMVYPGYLQGIQWSIMTRRYNGGADYGLTSDVFFETSETFAVKAYLMAKQVKRSGADPFTFILERYDLEPQREIYFNTTGGNASTCLAEIFGFTTKTKAKLATL